MLKLLPIALIAASFASAHGGNKHDLYEEQEKWSGACQRSSEKDGRQSPISLSSGTFSNARVENIVFSYKPANAEITDNGHTILVKFLGDPGYLSINGKKFTLKQFHFHKASEHTLDGKRYDMEVHFVHMLDDANSKPSAVALDFLVEPGPSSAAWKSVWNVVPNRTSMNSLSDHGEQQISTIDAVDARQLIPEKMTYFAYEGSLTTPNCDENLTHVVSTKPLQFDGEDIAKFSSYHAMNNRKLQPAGDVAIRDYRNVIEN